MSDSFGRSELETFLGRSAVDGERVGFYGGSRMRLSKPAETAAHLAQEVASSQVKGTAHRYRTNKVLQHHELAAELLQSRHSTEPPARWRDESDSEDSFVRKRQATSKRSKIVPKELNTPEATRQIKARHLYASSSSENESESATLEFKTPAESSEEEVVTQREKRRKRSAGSELVVPSSGSCMTHDSISALEGKRNASNIKKNPPKTMKSSESSEKSSGSSESSSSSSDASSESDDESTAVDIRPQFIPRKRRGLEMSYEQIQEADEKRSRIRANRIHSRKLESRAMVAKQVAFSAPSADQDHMEESYGASNIIPDDGNDSDEDLLVTHREAWEIREIERLLTTLQREGERESRKLAYEYRKKLTDEQVMNEDRKSGRYLQPGKRLQDTGTNPRRYYHRGAYYMDEEEWDDADVRYKSAEYAQAVTGEDKLDKSRLPEIMRRNKFGFARQNAKYKGLAAEDTSDERLNVLPIVKAGRLDCRPNK